MCLAVVAFSVTITFASGTDDSGFIEVDCPVNGSIYYAGETMTIDFSLYDTWEEYYSVPVLGYYKSGQSKAFDLESGEAADPDDWTSYSWKHSLAGYAPGRYRLFIMDAPGYSDGDLIDDWQDWEGIPSVNVYFSVRTLQAPKKLKITAGKKKVTIHFEKVSGASSYEVYRSTNKNKGYKRIGTIKKNNYVDKKVKRGKRYYYKVRAVRNVNGKVTSKYCNPKRSLAVR